jgi:hypothetical protein
VIGGPRRGLHHAVDRRHHEDGPASTGLRRMSTLRADHAAECGSTYDVHRHSASSLAQPISHRQRSIAFAALRPRSARAGGRERPVRGSGARPDRRAARAAARRRRTRDRRSRAGRRNAPRARRAGPRRRAARPSARHAVATPATAGRRASARRTGCSVRAADNARTRGATFHGGSSRAPSRPLDLRCVDRRGQPTKRPRYCGSGLCRRKRPGRRSATTSGELMSRVARPTRLGCRCRSAAPRCAQPRALARCERRGSVPATRRPCSTLPRPTTSLRFVEWSAAAEVLGAWAKRHLAAPATPTATPSAPAARCSIPRGRTRGRRAEPTRRCAARAD